MKVVAINGSPKKDGNTAFALETVLEELKNENIEVEILHVGNETFRGCTSCGGCSKNKDEKCILNGDNLNKYFQILKNADGILLGSPVYFSGMNGTLKSFLDRTFYVASVNGGLFRHKVGASVTAVRRSGGLPTFHQLNNFITYSEMVLVTSNYWNVIHGTVKGDAKKDAEGIQIMRVLGKNMAWMLKLIEYGKGNVLKVEKENKTYTHFVR